MEVLNYAWLVVALPLVAAGVIAAFGRLMPLKGSEVGIGAIAIAWVVSLMIGWQTFVNGPVEAVEEIFWSVPLGGSVLIEFGQYVDGLAAMMLVLVTTVSFMVQLYSREYMHGEDRFTYFFSMLSLFTFSMLVLVIAPTTLQALVGWELVGLCSYLLIGYYWREKTNSDAANKAFMVTKFGDIGLVVGIIVLSVGVSGSTDDVFSIAETNALAAAGMLSNSTVVLGSLMIFLAAMAKSGQMPLHVWLPDAMAGPTPVSALIHAATMVTAGVFVVARLFPVFAQSEVVMTTIAVVGVITLFFAGFLAIVQDDVKKVLAYSTVSQLGYMMAALGVGGYTAGVFHLFTHGFFKALLFLGSGSLIHAVHSNNMSDMGGMRKFMPVTFVTFVVGSLALAGFPLTAGFFSKDEVLVSAQIWADNGVASGLSSATLTGNLVFWLGLAGAMVTTFYMARSVFLIFFGEYRGPHHADAHDASLAPEEVEAKVTTGDLDDEAEMEDLGQAVGDHGGHEEEMAAVHAAGQGGQVAVAMGDGEPAGNGTAGGHGAGGGDDHHGDPHESGWQILTALVVLAVMSVPAGFAGGFLWDEIGGSTERNFETWTATPLIEETTYPFLDDYEPTSYPFVPAHGEEGEGESGEAAGSHDDEDTEAAAMGGTDGVALASAALAAESAEGEVSNHVLHGAPTFHLDVFVLALAGFLLALGVAWSIYGRGQPERDPVLHLGGLTTLLENKYYFDDVGYRGIVVPVRDHLAPATSWSSNVLIDRMIVRGTGGAVKRMAQVTYNTIDQKVIDGGINGSAFSASWISSKLKRLQSGDVQRYAGAMLAGVIVLVVVFAAAR